MGSRCGDKDRNYLDPSIKEMLFASSDAEKQSGTLEKKKKTTEEK